MTYTISLLHCWDGDMAFWKGGDISFH